MGDELDLRKHYLGYRPYCLGKLSKKIAPVPPGHTERLLEFMSWPNLCEDGRVTIYARIIGDPTSAKWYVCRKEISPVRWSGSREKAYKQGFLAGMGYAVEEVRKAQSRRA